MAGTIEISTINLVSPNGLVEKNLTINDSGAPLFDGSQLAINSFVSGQDLGVEQSWQDVTLNRTLNTNYINSTGKPIFVSVAASSSAGCFLVCLIDGTALWSTYNPTVGQPVSLSFVVPNGSTYNLNTSAGTGAVGKWSELR